MVENGKRITIDVKLSESVSQLKEIVVTGTRQVDNDFSLIKAIRESKLVVTGISAEMIGKTQDRDAADVVKRVPGITVVGGRFVNIRGLNERYNVTMLHNAYAPSMEVDKRSFAFDAYNSHDLSASIEYLSTAYSFYDFKRIEEFCQIILLTVLEGKFSHAEKDKLLLKLRSVKRSSSFVLTSLH